MGDRLRVRWDVEDLPMRAMIPALTVQPLLENAIGHGVEHLAGGGEVIVEGSSERRHRPAARCAIRCRRRMTARAHLDTASHWTTSANGSPCCMAEGFGDCGARRR